MVKYEHSVHPLEHLNYPIWMELEASDHFLLEPNIDRITELNTEFARDPWEFYERYKGNRPNTKLG